MKILFALCTNNVVGSIDVKTVGLDYFEAKALPKQGKQFWIRESLGTRSLVKCTWVTEKNPPVDGHDAVVCGLHEGTFPAVKPKEEIIYMDSVKLR